MESASGEASVGYFCYPGNTITFVITSDKNVTGATLTLCAASCTAVYDYTTWTSAIGEYDASEHDILTVNGKNVALSGVFPGNDDDDETTTYYKWATATATIDLVKGENTIVLTCDDSGIAVNVDYIEITTTASLTWKETNN